jgi:hypothetical protein
MSAAEDRRRFIRLPSRLNASYKVIGAEPNRNLLTRNTGGGGIGFFTESLLPPGTVLRVELKFPSRKKPVAFTAEVIWSGKLLLEKLEVPQPRAYEVGVRFLDIAPEDQEFLMDYSARSSDEPPSV